MSSVTADLRRALTTRGFFIGVCLTPLVMLLGAGQGVLPVLLHGTGDGLMNGFHASLVMEGTASDVMLFAAPILCALPYTVSFVDDIKSGYIKGCLPRIGKESYVKGKAVACFLSGGFALFVGVWLAYLLFALLFTPMELAPMPDMPSQPMFLTVMGQACIFFLNGALWSLAGLCMSSVTMNRYMAFASPFIFYYVLVILQERYFRDLYVLNPKNWLTAVGNWPGGSWGLALFLLVWSLALCFVFYAVAHRRLADA